MLLVMLLRAASSVPVWDDVGAVVLLGVHEYVFGICVIRISVLNFCSQNQAVGALLARYHWVGWTRAAWMASNLTPARAERLA